MVAESAEVVLRFAVSGRTNPWTCQQPCSSLWQLLASQISAQVSALRPELTGEHMVAETAVRQQSGAS